jgi:hypothetical protein
MKTGELNKTEIEYQRLLENRKQLGEIIWYKFDGINLRLADKTFYKPDFFVMLKSGELEVHEVKGFWTDDARVKIKVAASIYPLRFLAVTKKSGGWEAEEF